MQRFRSTVAALAALEAGDWPPSTRQGQLQPFARDQALAAARKVRATVVAAPSVLGAGGGTAVLGGGPDSDAAPWWLRLGSLLPLAVMLAGLVLIDHHYTRSQIDAAAEVDAAILADDLPPEAYRDQGFVEFLKTSRP